MRLAIELYGTRLGVLSGEERTFDLAVADEAVERFGLDSPVLSVAMPLTITTRRDQAGRRRNWFRELLPEGDQYDHMLTQGGLRRGDTLGFLARYGRDIAGALQIWDLDDPTEPRDPWLNPLTDQQVRQLLEDPLGTPLGNDPLGGKSSLGGVVSMGRIAGAIAAEAPLTGAAPNLQDQLAEFVRRLQSGQPLGRATVEGS